MSDGLSRLKQLGLGLEQEITDQNAQLDRIDTQIDRADVNIRNQNDQMKVILGQKKKWWEIPVIDWIVYIPYRKIVHIICNSRCQSSWANRWLGARLQYLQCISNGDTVVLH